MRSCAYLESDAVTFPVSQTLIILLIHKMPLPEIQSLPKVTTMGNGQLKQMDNMQKAILTDTTGFLVRNKKVLWYMRFNLVVISNWRTANSMQRPNKKWSKTTVSLVLLVQWRAPAQQFVQLATKIESHRTSNKSSNWRLNVRTNYWYQLLVSAINTNYCSIYAPLHAIRIEFMTIMLSGILLWCESQSSWFESWLTYFWCFFEPSLLSYRICQQNDRW